jgi:hypothetical protein
MKVDLETLLLIGNFNQISRINAWLLEMFLKSFPLRLLLSCGKVTTEMGPATSRHWYAPIVAACEMDEAATGAERTREPSDGAVDSRDDLNSHVRSLPTKALTQKTKFSRSSEANWNLDPQTNSLDIGEDVQEVAGTIRGLYII